MTRVFSYKVLKNSIVNINFDLQGESVNKFSTPVMKELDSLLDELKSFTEIKAGIFTSGKQEYFIVGADIDEIRDVNDPKTGEEKAKAGQALFSKFEQLPFPMIAVVDGMCLGGGTEMILAFNFRIATDNPKTRIGLPEIKLGIIPGFGGTQRLPRLIGIQKALAIILAGRDVSAKSAYRMGLVDKIIPKENVLDSAVEFASEIVQKGGKKYIDRRNNIGKNLPRILLEGNPIGRSIVFHQAKKQLLRKTRGHYPAPLKALQAVQEGITKTLQAGMNIEAKYLGEMISTDVSKNLINIYYLQENTKKQIGVEKAATNIKTINTAGVLGAGVMGGGIAQLMAHNNIPVKMKDIKPEFIEKGLQSARKIFENRVRRGRMTGNELEEKMQLITGRTDFTGFDKINLLIEAIIEDIEIKKNVIQETEKHLSGEAIFVSNTSSLSITEMAKASSRPEKFAGLHFFNPVHRMPLVEIIRGEMTNDETIATVYEFSKQIKKTPIVVKDSPGFLVNRLLMPYLNEAMLLLEEGGSIKLIDQSMLNFGMPMGPIELLDEVGIDVAYKVGMILRNAFGERMEASVLPGRLTEQDRLGKKNGLGFYRYNGRGKKIESDISSKLDLKKGKLKPSEKWIQRRLVFSMINEASRCLNEKVVLTAQDVDIGMIFGTGFPPFRGGLLRYADSIGSSTVFNELKLLEDKYGNRFAPSSLLTEMARSNRKFYSE